MIKFAKLENSRIGLHLIHNRITNGFLFSLFFIVLSLLAAGNWYSLSAMKTDSDDANSGISFTTEQANRTDEFKKYDGMVIRSITIDSRDVFGSSIDQPPESSITWYAKTGNFFHIKTRQWVIRAKLLFSKGQKLHSFDLNESERLLRESGLFTDARIVVKAAADAPDEVDVTVITRDRWSLQLPLNYTPSTNSGTLKVHELNFIGLGHRIDAVMNFSRQGNIVQDGSFSYAANNLEGSYIDGRIRYESIRDRRLRGIDFQRKFFSPHTRWAGGVELNWVNDVGEIYDGTTLIERIPYSFGQQDFWIGRSFAVSSDGKYRDHRLRLITAGRVSLYKFKNRPNTITYHYPIFDNSSLVLGAAGVNKIKYFREHYLNSFGTTEDVATGFRSLIISGVEEREFDKRFYGGIELLGAHWFQDFGYVGGRIAFGGFRSGADSQQKVFNVSALYYSPLFRQNQWKFRMVSSGDIKLGINRFEGEQIFLDRNTGMRGFSDRSLPGTRRVVMNLEARIFSPYAPLGFGIGGILFTDLGMIGNERNGLSHSRLYRSYGMGIRTQNLSLSRNIFELAGVFIPYNPDSGHSSLGVILSTKIELNFPDIAIGKPQIIPFEEQ